MRPITKIALAVGTALALGLAGAAVNAHPQGGSGVEGSCPGAGYGGPMGRGYGMGPGAMGGWGYGMGPGMMRGYEGRGMGPGMMYGYGPGLGRGAGLNLTDEQRDKIAKIQGDLRSKQWALMDRIRDEYARRADASDDAAAAKADDQIGALQQQMLSNSTAARKQIDGVLTQEQRQQLRRGG